MTHLEYTASHKCYARVFFLSLCPIIFTYLLFSMLLLCNIKSKGISLRLGDIVDDVDSSSSMQGDGKLTPYTEGARGDND